MSLNKNLIESDGSPCNLNSFLGHIPIFFNILSKNNILDNEKLFKFISNNFDMFCAKSILPIIINNDNHINNYKIKKKYNIPVLILYDINQIVADYYGCKIRQNLFGSEYETVKNTTMFINQNGVVVQKWDHLVISEVMDYFTK